MAEYRLFPAAEADSIAIYLHGHDRFGSRQAEAYHEGLRRAFGLLAEFPLLGMPAEDLHQGLRRWRHGVHVIFYTVDG